MWLRHRQHMMLLGLTRGLLELLLLLLHQLLRHRLPMQLLLLHRQLKRLHRQYWRHSSEQLCTLADCVAWSG